MRARLLAAAAVLALACGKAPAPPKEILPRDGFLDCLPADAHVVIRLPPLREVEARRAEFAAFATALGLPGDLYAGTGGRGLDPARAGGVALTPAGGWTRFFPAGDRAALAEALRAEVAKGRAFREEGAWALLSQGAEPGALAGEALPPGDLALRARHHPLLTHFAHAGDTLELGLRCLAGGLLFEGFLRSGAGGATEEALARAAQAAPGAAGVEFLPAYLAIRAETTLPPVLLAEFFAGHVSAHARLAEERDRATLVRLLREALSGADPSGPFAFGLDATGGSVTFVCTGVLASGPRSPILERLRSGERAAFGPLVVEERRRPEGDAGSWIGLSAWLPQSEPLLDGLPRCLWAPLGALCDEEAGLPVLHAEREGRFVCAVGPRADALAFETLRKLAAGGERAGAAWALHELRKEDPARFVLGAVVNGKSLGALPEEDRSALRSAIGLPPGAAAPTDIVLAGYRDGSHLRLQGRVAY